MARRSDTVSVAFVHGSEVSYSWHQSMMALVAHDVASRQHVVRGGWLATKYGTGGITQARNDTAARFLADCDSDWLFWVDTDMGFAPDSVDRLLDVAHHKDRPVVGGLCFMMREVGIDGMGGMIVQPRPTIFAWTKVSDAEGFHAVDDYPRDQLVPVAGTGSAFLLIHRSALERIRDEFGPTWYSQTVNPSTGMLLSEDLSFCVRLGALDIPVHVHTGVKTTHLKQAWVDERLFDRLERAS